MSLASAESLAFDFLFSGTTLTLALSTSYVPVKIDYSDVYDIMTYFVGTPDGRGSHDSVAERLGAQGKEWARTHWRMADMA